MIRTFQKINIARLLSGFFAVGFFGASVGHAAGTMRDMTSMQIVSDMKVGWNLGNTLDATANGITGLATETYWGNPKTTKAMIDAVKTKGFNTVRIPVTWTNHFGAGPTYTIDKSWLDRVEEVVKYAIDDGIYVILNSHHDEWVTLTTSTQTDVTDKITKIWAQIADRFKDYSDYLVFETLNEPRPYGAPTEWTGGTTEARTVLNAYNLAIVNTIRSSGGNNALRHIMIPTVAATALEVAQNALVVPANDKRIIISQHTYWPYNFTLNKTEAGATSKWGTASDKAACDTELDRIQNKFVKSGIPVVIGEWGSIDKSNTADRAGHAEYYAKAARLRGMLSVYWDNGAETSGGFALLRRSTCTWLYPTIVDGLIKGVQDGTPVLKQPDKKAGNAAFLEFSSGVLRYTLSKSSNVSLRIYTIQGNKIWHGINEYATAGSHTIKLPETGISWGNYILELKSDNSLFTKKICITK